MACRGGCSAYRMGNVGGGGGTKRSYGDGICWCRTCEQYLMWAGAFCPCCGTRVGNHSRSNRVRRKRADSAPRMDGQTGTEMGALAAAG